MLKIYINIYIFTIYTLHKDNNESIYHAKNTFFLSRKSVCMFILSFYLVYPLYDAT